MSANAAVGSAGLAWAAVASDARRDVLSWARPIDLRDAADARLQFRSRLISRASTAAAQVSTDGVTWQTVAAMPATDEWMVVDIDLSPLAGRIVWIRFLFDAIAPATNVVPPDVWWIDQVDLTTSWRPR